MSVLPFVIPQPPQPVIAVAGETILSSPPHLVRRPQLPRPCPRVGPRRARAAVLLRQARRHDRRRRRDHPLSALTRDLHHEVELIVAMKSGGCASPPTPRSITSTATPSASTSPGATCKTPRAKRSSPGKSQNRSITLAPCSALQPAARSGIRRRATSGSRSMARKPNPTISRR